VEQRQRPTPLQYFHGGAFFAAFHDDDGQQRTGFYRSSPVQQIVGPSNLKDALANCLCRTEAPSEEYLDTHCLAFTPVSFELLISDCVYLGLLQFEIVEIAGSSKSSTPT
jgi:hypothetical protein